MQVVLKYNWLHSSLFNCVQTFYTQCDILSIVTTLELLEGNVYNVCMYSMNIIMSVLQEIVCPNAIRYCIFCSLLVGCQHQLH